MFFFSENSNNKRKFEKVVYFLLKIKVVNKIKSWIFKENISANPLVYKFLRFSFILPNKSVLNFQNSSIK